MPNRLGHETSPYLLQHAENPVDWYPWGEEALEKARREDLPVLVSIGYSACHWCHVMAHESFEDPDTAALMNRSFVNIKVDREERPDVDAIYMEAVQLLTGQGGWPLNAFLTPDGQPFYGGTYFPPEPRHGLPSWRQVLEGVSDAYRQRRDEVTKSAAALSGYIRQAQQVPAGDEPLSEDVLRQAHRDVTRGFDWAHGGFGGAPKFPQPLSLEFVLRMWHRWGDEQSREFAFLTLDRMASGGIFDQLGGGFHRYSVDAAWVVPHFEKMLYDNALLTRVYLQAFQISHAERFRSIAEQTLDYLLRELRSPQGAFFSSQDADSEGVEGKYYVWTVEELENLLTPEEAQVAALRFGVTPQGNFDGKTILTAAMTTEGVAERLGRPVTEVEQLLAMARARLLEARSDRTPPGKDTKVIAGWNALAVRALAEAGAILERADYLAAARQAADFVWTAMRPAGNLSRSYLGRPSTVPAFLEDYAYLLEALLTLFEATAELDWLARAEQLAAEMVQRFWDDAQGGFYDTPLGLEEPVARPRSLFDNPIPSGNSAAVFGLLRLEALTGESAYLGWALPVLRAATPLAGRAPLGFSYLLSALDFYLSPPLQVAIVGPPDEAATGELARAVRKRYLPNAVLAIGTGERPPLLAGRSQLEGRPTAYVCRHFSCQFPVTNPDELAAQLDSAAEQQRAGSVSSGG